MTSGSPQLRKFDGHWLAFPNTLFSKSREYMTAEERQVADIVRAIIEGTSFVGRDPIATVHAIEQRALDAIERDGIQAFIQRHGQAG